MKRLTLLLVLSLIPAFGEPLAELLDRWACSFDAVAAEARVIADSVRGRYSSPTYYVDDARDPYEPVAAVLFPGQVRDTTIGGVHHWVTGSGYDSTTVVQAFDYNRFRQAELELGHAIGLVVPHINPVFKSGAFFRSSGFDILVSDYEDLYNVLLAIAVTIRDGDVTSGSVSSFPAEVRSWDGWYDVRLELEDVRVDQALADFDIRYGPRSDRINLLEMVLINLAPPFKGNINGPSAWEPILRFTPVCYDISDNRFAKTYQVGANYYFLSGSPGLLKWLNHVGVAFAAADLASDQLYKFSFGELSCGAMLHIGKYQVGMFKDHGGESWKFLTTVDFQVIPALF